LFTSVIVLLSIDITGMRSVASAVPTVLSMYQKVQYWAKQQ
jgi:hypothetical protein